MKIFKLAVPQKYHPKKFSLKLQGIDNVLIEIRFLHDFRNVVSELVLDDKQELYLEDDQLDSSQHSSRDAELLADIDINSSGGFIPPDIAAKLDEVVETSQRSISPRKVKSVIPGLYCTPEKMENSDNDDNDDIVNSDDDDEDCFVPATQPQVSSFANDNDNIEVFSSDDNDDIAEAKAQYTGNESEVVPETQDDVMDIPSVRNVEIDIKKRPETAALQQTLNQPSVDVTSNEPTVDIRSDSDDSFAGEPVVESQEVDTKTKKKFVKKRAMVCLSSDDEEIDDKPKQRSLPDLDSEMDPIPAQANDQNTDVAAAHVLPKTNDEIATVDPAVVGRTGEPAETKALAPELIEISDEDSPTDEKVSACKNDPNTEPKALLQTSENTGVSETEPHNSQDNESVHSEEILGTENHQLDINGIIADAKDQQLNKNDPLSKEELVAETQTSSQAVREAIESLLPGEGDKHEVPETENQQTPAIQKVQEPAEQAIVVDPSKDSFCEESLRLELFGNTESAQRTPEPHKPFPPLSRRVSQTPEGVDNQNQHDQQNSNATNSGPKIIYGPRRVLTTAKDVIESVVEDFMTNRESLPNHVTPLNSKVHDWLGRHSPGQNMEYFEKLIPCPRDPSPPASPVIEAKRDFILRAYSATPVVEKPVDLSINVAAKRKKSADVKNLKAVNDALSDEEEEEIAKNMAEVFQQETFVDESDKNETAREVESNVSRKLPGVKIAGLNSEDEVPETPAGEETPRSARRKKLFFSQDNPVASEPMGKIVDSQEVDRFGIQGDIASPSAAARKKPVRGRAGTARTFAKPATPKTSRNRNKQTKTKADSKAKDKNVESLPNPRARKTKPAEAEEILVPETAPEESLESAENPADVVEETPIEKPATRRQSGRKKTEKVAPVDRRSSTRNQKTAAAEVEETAGRKSNKCELPDPYTKETIEVEEDVLPPTERKTRSSNKTSKTGSSDFDMKFSEEISPHFIETKNQPGPSVKPATRGKASRKAPEPKNPMPSKRAKLDENPPEPKRNSRKASSGAVPVKEVQNTSFNDSFSSIDSLASVNRKAKMRIMFTGVENPPRDKVIELGMKATEMICECNVVVAAKFTRTVKMMYAVAKGIPVVDMDWIHQSSKAKKILDLSSFLLCDKAAESKYSFSLAEALQKSAEEKLFEGWKFFVTKSCVPKPEQVREMLAGCNAKVINELPTKFAEKTVIVSCKADRKSLPAKPAVPLVKVDFVLTGILQHRINLEEFAL